MPTGTFAPVGLGHLAVPAWMAAGPVGGHGARAIGSASAKGEVTGGMGGHLPRDGAVFDGGILSLSLGQPAASGAFDACVGSSGPAYPRVGASHVRALEWLAVALDTKGCGIIDLSADAHALLLA